ncbi:hypothetical protein GCM10009574_083610 [Streptomyces asiaticus]
MGLTAALLEELDLRPDQRVLDVGTGAGVTVAVACQVCGDQQVVTVDWDRHLTEAAAVRLADLGFRPQVVRGSGEQGCLDRAFERNFVSYTVERVPAALVEQLAPGGKLLAHVTTASPSWSALAFVEGTADGQLQAELRAVEFAHRAGHGIERIFLTEEFRQRIATGPGAGGGPAVDGAGEHGFDDPGFAGPQQMGVLGLRDALARGGAVRQGWRSTRVTWSRRPGTPRSAPSRSPVPRHRLPRWGRACLDGRNYAAGSAQGSPDSR